MSWVNRVFLLAGILAVAATLLTFLCGFGWLSLMAALPTFIAVSVLVPFFLGVRDRRLTVERRLRQGKRSRNPKRRMQRPAPAVVAVARAPLAERGGRVFATLPAAPL